MLADLKRDIQGLSQRLEELRVSLDLSGKEKEIGTLEEKITAQDFWGNPQDAQNVLQRLTALKDKVKPYCELLQKLEDLEVLWELGMEEKEEELGTEIKNGLETLVQRLDQLELDQLFRGPYDGKNALLSLHPGAGGTESQDWAQMLLRMYTRWAEERGYQVEILDYLPAEEAGLKSVTLLVKGENAYGNLRTEKGVHRLVRISPFDASGRRHTSFASVDVMPEVEEEAETLIDPSELKIDTFRSGGAGGQHVNKTDSAVRMTHLPTGVVVQCQNERSQHANRLAAMKILQARLFERQQRQQEEQLAQMRGEQQDIAWGSQIRSYVFHPYSMVKDHRTGVEIGNVSAVMDGDLEPFISAALRNGVGS
ncbi:MAG: peptide chain release factor 2 [Bacillota bacterium]